MKRKFIESFSTVPRLILQTSLTIFLISFLAGCSCIKLCTMAGKSFGSLGVDCANFCEPSTSLAITKREGSADSVVSVGNPIPQKKSPGQLEGPAPGEYFATTITAGPLLNFKSSEEEYGGGYGEHKPGVGFQVGVGTVLPLNKRWAIAPSFRVTQKNASENLGYSEPGGGGSMDFEDKYSYSYIGGVVLAQYRATRRLSVVAGPEVNYLLAASVKNGGSSGTGEKQKLDESSQKVGFDILAGIKYEIPSATGRSKWGLQLIYDHRLSRLNTEKDESGTEIPAYRMKSVQLGIAYNICGCGKRK